jgi:hypothetical protein
MARWRSALQRDVTQPTASTRWIRRRTPPSTSEIVGEAAIFLVSILIGTVVALYLDGRVRDIVVILVAGVLTIMSDVLIYRLVFGRLPAVVGRPGRYSVPNAIGLIAAGFVTLAQNITIAMIFPVAMGMILIGNALSDYQWSRAERRR